MTPQIRPKLLPLFLIFCIAFLPLGQSFATDMEPMETMAEFCPDCDFDKDNNTCDTEEYCLTTACISSFTFYQSALINTTVHQNANLISSHGDYGEPRFQSQPPGSLYRPPIIW